MRGALLAVRNVLKAWLLLVGGCAILGALGWSVGGYRLASALVFTGFLLGGAAYWYVDRFVLTLLGARELPLGEAPALHSTVERLAAAAPMPPPKLYLISSPHPHALATGRGPPGGAAIAVSSGLVAACPPAELEGVIAHELAHIRNRDVLITTSVVA